jgi:hypothetical protein
MTDLNMSNDNEDVGESTVLATFRRRHPQTGAFEQVRITTGVFRDRQVTHFRTYYQAHRNPTAVDDGFRPTTNGIVVREAELDSAIEALQEAKWLVESQGRRCSPAPEGQRNPRPRTIAKQREREAQQRPQEPQSADDELWLVEARKRRP